MRLRSAERVRLGIVGAGLMGGVHARVFSADPRAQVVAIIDSDAVVREARADAAALHSLHWTKR